MGKSISSLRFTRASCAKRAARLCGLPVLLAVVFAAAMGGGALCPAAEPAVSRQPANILVLLSDDHCYRALGRAGNRDVRTPNLDRLATEGVYFDHCFTPMPQCSPSRAAFFTGQDCWTSGVRRGTTPFKKDAVLWPQLLDAAGYQTFITGKWHNADMPWDCGFNRGENLYVGGMSDHSKVRVIQWRETKKDKRPAEGFSSTLFAETAMRFLRNRDASRPFCAYVSFTAPHDPWTPPGDYATMYDPAQIELPANFMARPPFRLAPDFLELRDQKVLPFPRTEADVRRGMALYYGMLTHLDREIGRILDTLEELGLADDTLVIFAGDHGHSLASHGFVGKQCMYEEGIRTPLIMRYPQVMRGEDQCEALVSLVDLFPTICQAAGIAVPTSVEGSSLVPLYQGEQPPWRTHVFASHHLAERHEMSSQCIRTERYKLIDHHDTGELELFDLETDPLELINLANDPKVADLQSQLWKQLSEWSATHYANQSDQSQPEE